MSPTLQEENLESYVSIFDENEPQPVALYATDAAVSTLDRSDRMDTFLSAIKWTFLFVPGAAAIHMAVMIMSMSVMTGIWPGDTIPQMLGSLILFSFLVLFGLGRLTDFRYFKVVAAIIASSLLSAVVVQIFASFVIGYANFGWAMLITLPLTLAFAHIIKRRIDEERPV
jgi:hypothetical protein